MPVCSVITQATDSIALEAPMQWPIMLLIEVTGSSRSPKMARITLASMASLAWVPVPCALMWSTSSGVMPLDSIAWRMAEMLPSPSGCGRVMWCASQASP